MFLLILIFRFTSNHENPNDSVFLRLKLVRIKSFFCFNKINFFKKKIFVNRILKTGQKNWLRFVNYLLKSLKSIVFLVFEKLINLKVKNGRKSSICKLDTQWKANFCARNDGTKFCGISCFEFLSGLYGKGFENNVGDVRFFIGKRKIFSGVFAYDTGAFGIILNNAGVWTVFFIQKKSWQIVYL